MTFGPRYFDVDGNPLKLMEWAKLFEDRDKSDGWWLIGFDQVGDMTVSTVWVGIDMAPLRYGDEPPVIFESMIFGVPLDGEQYRYSTKEQAAEGHARLVSLVQAEHALSI